MTLFTIGFTRSTAERFFDRLAAADVRLGLDTRVQRRGQLSGFAKEADLAFFVPRLTRARYRVEPLLTPADELFRAYRRRELSWELYAETYRASLVERRVAERIARADIDGARARSLSSLDCGGVSSRGVRTGARDRPSLIDVPVVVRRERHALDVVVLGDPRRSRGTVAFP